MIIYCLIINIYGFNSKDFELKYLQQKDLSNKNNINLKKNCSDLNLSKYVLLLCLFQVEKIFCINYYYYYHHHLKEKTNNKNMFFFFFILFRINLNKYLHKLCYFLLEIQTSHI
jgi:hypothetical protein